MTETDKPYLVEHDRIMTTTNVHFLNMTENDWIWLKIKNNFFGHIHLVTVRHCGNIYCISDLWSYSPINVRHFGNIHSISGQVHYVNVSHCQHFGQVHQFRSYSFGHLDSVKWLTLFVWWQSPDFVISKLLL